MRSFNVDGIASDCPDQLQPASFLVVLHVTLSRKTWTLQTAYTGPVK
jgi:hypothetical protein